MKRLIIISLFVASQLSIMINQGCAVNTLIKNGTLSIKHSYKGMASFDMEFKNQVVVPEPMVIKTQDDYDKLVEMIPKYQMTPTYPAPESDDPLLKKPAINFKTDMMVAVFRFNANSFPDIEIKKLEAVVGVLHILVYYETKDKYGTSAKAINYGSYHAVVVQRFDGEIVFDRE